MKPMKIAIYNNGIAFDGNTPSQRPLGGSESGIVYMARELAASGHSVTVYCNCPEAGPAEMYDGVAYVHYHQFFTHYQSAPWDAVIAFRSFDPLLLGRIAPRMIYWTGDASNQPALENFGHAALQQNVDLVFCVSGWHRDSFIHKFELSPEKVIATRNGFLRDAVVHGGPRDIATAAYTSTPFRGLDILLEVFPAIRCRVPAAALDVFSSMKVYGWTADQDQQAYGAIYEAARQPGVTLKGSVNQRQLMRTLGKTGLLLYPNTFEETSCIAAIEAQASGCVVVTSARAGLKETVAHQETGILIDGDPRSTEYKRHFMEAAVGLMTNLEMFAAYSTRARERAFRQYTWSAIAAEWTKILEDMPAQQVSGRFTGPLSLINRAWGYVRAGNMNAAQRIITDVDAMPFFRHETEGLKERIKSGSQELIAR
jgi:glycosyltransferase involved in cell wall biosynthesis